MGFVVLWMGQLEMASLIRVLEQSCKGVSRRPPRVRGLHLEEAASAEGQKCGLTWSGRGIAPVWSEMSEEDWNVDNKN